MVFMTKQSNLRVSCRKCYCGCKIHVDGLDIHVMFLSVGISHIVTIIHR